MNKATLLALLATTTRAESEPTALPPDDTAAVDCGECDAGSYAYWLFVEDAAACTEEDDCANEGPDRTCAVMRIGAAQSKGWCADEESCGTNLTVDHSDAKMDLICGNTQSGVTENLDI